MLSLTVILSTSTALLFGCSDFFGGLASRRDSALAVTANSHILGALMLAAAVWVFPSTGVSTADLAWGAFSGVAGGIGVVSLYAALATGRMSVVAPLTAALSGSLPALFDLARGSHVEPTGIVGLALALVAVIVVSATSGEDENGVSGTPPLAIALSFAAGVGFAAAVLGFSFTAPGSGLWPVLAARTTSAVLLGALTFARNRRLRVDSSAMRPTLAAGALDATANVTMITAIRIGPLAVASVIGSLYPVVVVILARFVLGERVRPMQKAGIVLAMVAVVLTALP